MKQKNLLTRIPSKYILNDIFSYCPENISKNIILNLFRYNKKLQNLFNIKLYTYQKEYLNINLALKKVNPREYNISKLHNYFKSKNAFNNKKDKEIFIKILKEIFPEEKKEEESDIVKDLKLTKITIFHLNKNLTSIELSDLPKKYDLKQINTPNIKKLKISGGSIIKMPFSLLNKLEALLLGYAQIKIYSIPENKNTFELKNLKYLELDQTGVTKKLNKKFYSPNLIYLNLTFVAYYKKIFYLAYYFNLYGDEEEEKNENKNNVDNDNDSFSNKEDYEDFDESHIHEYNDILPQYDIDNYYGKYINLKYLSLLFYDDSTLQMSYEKILKCVKLTDNIIKCYDYKNESSDYEFSITESFFYDQKTEKRFRIQADMFVWGSENYFNFDYDNNDFEKIKFQGYFLNDIGNPLIPVVLENINNDNYSLQVIKIEDDYEQNMKKENFMKFAKNIKKFLFLREISIKLTSNNYENIIDSEDIDLLINNLFTLKLLENIYIEINNPKIQLSKEISKLFDNMEILEEKKDENKYLKIFWKYNEKYI